MKIQSMAVQRVLSIDKWVPNIPGYARMKIQSMAVQRVLSMLSIDKSPLQNHDGPGRR